MAEESSVQEKIDYSKCDPETLRALYSEAWELYRHEDNLCESRNSQFLSLSSTILGIAGALMAYIATQFQSAYLDYLGDEVFTDQRISVCLSCILLILVIVFFLRLLRRWEAVNDKAHQYVRVRLENARIIEEALKDKQLITENLCIAFNDKNRFSSEKDDDPIQESLSVNGVISYFKTDNRSGGFGTTQNIIRLFRRYAWPLLGVAMLLFVLFFISFKEEPILLALFKRIK